MRTSKEWYKKSPYNIPVNFHFLPILIFTQRSYSMMSICVLTLPFYKLSRNRTRRSSTILPHQQGWIKFVWQAKLSSVVRSDVPTQSVDFRTVTMNHDAQLTRYHDEWSRRFAEQSDPNGNTQNSPLPPTPFFPSKCARLTAFVTDPGCAFRCSLLPLYVYLACVKLGAWLSLF